MDAHRSRPTILVVGGYGFFGARIARWLAEDRAARVLIGGRDVRRSTALASELRSTFEADVEPFVCDVTAVDLASQLRASGAHFVVHTVGPFQQQDYRVARACIEVGAHYVDLADAREYVTGIRALDSDARRAGVAVISGASTVPAISMAAVAFLSKEFAHVDVVDIGISVGNRTERGLATMQAVLGYCGRPFKVMRGGGQRVAYGWQDLARHRYPSPVGMRWIAACDVPDLDLLPERFGSLLSVSFRAGLELGVLQIGMWMLALAVRCGAIRDLPRHAQMLSHWAGGLRKLGSDVGAMHVMVQGRRRDGAQMKQTWTLVACDGLGPMVPCTAATVLARHWLRGELPAPGASPCVGMLTLAEIEAAWSALPFTTRIDKVS